MKSTPNQITSHRKRHINTSRSITSRASHQLILPSHAPLLLHPRNLVFPNWFVIAKHVVNSPIFTDGSRILREGPAFRKSAPSFICVHFIVRRSHRARTPRRKKEKAPAMRRHGIEASISESYFCFIACREPPRTSRPLFQTGRCENERVNGSANNADYHESPRRIFQFSFSDLWRTIFQWLHLNGDQFFASTDVQIVNLRFEYSVKFNLWKELRKCWCFFGPVIKFSKFLARQMEFRRLWKLVKTSICSLCI